MIYSFYNPPIKERLKDHVINALQTFNPNSKLVKVGEKLNPNFYKILEYAIIFHDFGKTFFNQYFFNPAKPLYFTGHEIISCWGANKYLSVIVDKGELEVQDKKIILLAVLLHHHPMDLKERGESLKYYHKDKIVNAQTFQLFYQELSDIVEEVQIDVNKYLEEIVDEIMGGYGLIKELWYDVWISEKAEVKKAFLLALQGLIAADYNSSNKTRGEGTSEFAKTIQTFLKFYATRDS